MSRIKVSEMPPANALTGAEIFPIVQGGANKNATLGDLRSLISATGDLSYDSATGVISLTAAGVSQGDNISLLTNDAGYLTSETTTSISFDNTTNTLSYTDETATITDIDLSLYLDDTNLARLTSGTVDGSGIATFTRDDDTTFTVDFSSLFDDTNLSRITSAGFNSTNGTLTLTRDDASTVTADLDGRYLQSYTETDTLDSVTGRGSATTNSIDVNGVTAQTIDVGGGVTTPFLVELSTSSIADDAKFISYKRGNVLKGGISGDSNGINYLGGSGGLRMNLNEITPVQEFDSTKRDDTTNLGTGFAGFPARFKNLYLSGSVLVSDQVTDMLNGITSDSDGSLRIFADDENVETNSNISFTVDNSEAMRIDSSGNVLVGTTSVNPQVSGTAGAQISPIGLLGASRIDGQSLDLNRQSSDGEIARFRIDGSTVGVIYGESTGRLGIGSGNCAIRFENSAIMPKNANTFAPQDNVIQLGDPNQRFKDLYLGGGVYLGGANSANYLDDYEEGTWTPTFSRAHTTNPGNTSTGSSGTYTKIGNKVFLQGTLNYDDTISVSEGDFFAISGIPFTGSIFPSSPVFGATGTVAMYNVNGSNENAWGVTAHEPSGNEIKIKITSVSGASEYRNLTFNATYLVP